MEQRSKRKCCRISHIGAFWPCRCAPAVCVVCTCGRGPGFLAKSRYLGSAFRAKSHFLSPQTRNSTAEKKNKRDMRAIEKEGRKQGMANVRLTWESKMVRAVSTCSHYTCCRTLPFMLTRTPIDVPQIVRMPLQLTPSTSVNPDENDEISTTILSSSHATCCMLYGCVTSQHGCHEQHRSCTCIHLS